MTKYFSLVTSFLLVVAFMGAGVVAVCAVLLAKHSADVSASLPLNSPWSPISIGLFLLVSAGASAFSILVPNEDGETSSQDLGTVGFLAAVVVFPGYVAVLIVAAVAIFDQLTFRGGTGRARRFVAFNFGNWVLSTAAAALVFNLFGGRSLLLHPKLPKDGFRLVLTMAGTVSVSYIISYGLTVIALALVGRALARRRVETTSSPRRPIGTVIRETFTRSHRNAILPEATAAIVGILFGYLWLVSPPLAPVALLPLAVIYIAFKNFIRLQELDRLKSNFITEVSHELRTPLSAILASSELLYHHGDRLDAANVKDLSRSSYESSNHLFRLVENLLNASTLQSGTLNIRPVSVSLDELVAEAVVQTQPFLESKRQVIDLCLPLDLPEVLADPQHIVQVLINLLTNASKYSEAETRIGISCTAEGEQVRVAIIDQGIGIAEEDQTHIFERFYRVPSQTMTSIVGSGLGLNIVRSLVAMHRGNLGVDSKPGQGSTFWFTLPVVSMAGAS